jgi:single-stranded DNA-binding protein
MIDPICLFPFSGMNSVTLLGRVGLDPQVRGTGEHPVVTFPLATNYRFRPGGAGKDIVYASQTTKTLIIRT